MKSTDMPDTLETLAFAAKLEEGAGRAAQIPDRERYAYEEAWPDDVWCIGIDRVDLLGVESRGQLYWDGNRVEVRPALSLS